MKIEMKIKWDLMKIKNDKGNYKQCEKTAFRMGENNSERSN